MSRRHRSSILVGGLMAVLCAAVPAQALELVREGKAVASVVTNLPPEALEQEKPKGRKARQASPEEAEEALAVRTLVEWIKKISDAELPLVAAPLTLPSPQGGEGGVRGTQAIYVGKAAVKAGLKLDDIASPSHEGLRIVSDDKRVLIGGQSAPATLKAVCRFLEELGCRYFMDGPLGEVFPRARTLSVGALAIAESPGLLGRNPKGPTWNAALWKAWNGAGGEALQHQHAWGHYLPAGLFNEHPEFFAMGADGQRKQGDWVCTSNQELRKYFAARVIATIEGGLRHPSLSPPDGRGYCQCPACKAQDDPKSIEPSSGVVSLTNRYVDFFDDVGRRVAAVHPDSVLCFYCYADYTQPPLTLPSPQGGEGGVRGERKLSPNLCAFIAPIRYCRMHEIGHEGCPSREQQVGMLEGWAKVASRLGYYNYMYNLADGTLPFFKFTACAKEIPYLKAKGLSFMTIEVLSNWHIYGPQIYLSLRLAYDPKADATAIMEDYWQKFYGQRAAPFMKQYWMGIDAAQGRLQSHAGSFFGLQQIYTPEFLKQCESLLAQAAEAARGDERCEQRVALANEGLKSAAAYRVICGSMAQGDFAGANKTYEETVVRLRSLADRGLANREYATAYLERFVSKTVRAGASITAPPNKVLQVLPERWRFALDEQDRGSADGYAKTEFDDSKWPLVSTYEKTLDVQGFYKTTVLWYRTKFNVPEKHGLLTLFFGEVDGLAEVHVNGQKMDPDTEFPDAATPSKARGKGNRRKAAQPGVAKPKPAVADGRVKARMPFTVDITDAVHPGENVVALRADHSKITDLSLGGILRPVLLIEEAE